MTKREEFELNEICEMDSLCWGDGHAYIYLKCMHNRKDLFSYMFWKEYHLNYKDSLLTGFVKNGEFLKDDDYISDEIFERNLTDVSSKRFNKELAAIQKSIK